MPLDTNQIENILKHRYPFLFIDRVLELEEGKRAKGLKCVTINEGFFEGHFPGYPVMPGALILEAMAQLCAVTVGKKEGYVGLLTSVYSAKFLRPVLSGDRLIIEVELTQKVRELVCFKATAKVDDNLAAKAELGFIILPKEKMNLRGL